MLKVSLSNLEFENFIKEEGNTIDLFLDSQTFASHTFVFNIRSYLILMSIIFLIFSSFIVSVAIIIFSNNDKINNFSDEINEINFGRIIDSNLINMNFLKWLESLTIEELSLKFGNLYNKVELDNFNSVSNSENFQKFKSTITDLYNGIPNKFGRNIDDIMLSKTLYEILTSIESFDKTIVQKYAISKTLFKEYKVESDYKHYCDFFESFSSVMIERIKSNRLSFLNYDKTLNKFLFANELSKKCYIRKEYDISYSPFMSSTSFDLLTFLKKNFRNDFLKSNETLSRLFHVLLFRSMYDSYTNFLIRNFEYQVKALEFISLREKMLFCLIFLNIVILITYLVYDYVYLSNRIYKLLYKKTIVFILPIENILDQNPDFQQSSGIF